MVETARLDNEVAQQQAQLADMEKKSVNEGAIIDELKMQVQCCGSTATKVSHIERLVQTAVVCAFNNHRAVALAC